MKALFYISFGVFCYLLKETCGLAVRRLPQIKEVHSSNKTKDTKIYYTHFNLLKGNVKNCLVKLI